MNFDTEIEDIDFKSDNSQNRESQNININLTNRVSGYNSADTVSNNQSQKCETVDSFDNNGR